MFEFNVKIANLPIKIISKYSYIYEQCKPYLSDENELFVVSATQSDIAYEATLSEKINGFVPDECYLENTAIYRLICNELIKYDAFLMHSAVIRINGRAVAFIGKSGSGKTTHSRFWTECFDAEYINGDKPIYRLIDGKFYAFGTPWCGKEMYGANISAPIKAVVKVIKANENKIESLSSFDAVPLALTQIYSKKDEISLGLTMDLLDKFLLETPVFMLYCKKEPESAIVAFDAIKNYL